MMIDLLFIDKAFPLLITVSAPSFDAAEMRSMTEGFERYFLRGERYALLSASPRNAPVPGPRERQQIAEWANHPRIRDFSKRLCVGSATVIRNPVARAALTVIMAVWKPPTPFEVAPSAERGLDYCLERVREARLVLAKPQALVRHEMLMLLNDVL